MTNVESCVFLPRPDLLRAHAFARSFDPHLHDTLSVVIMMQGRARMRSALCRGIARAGDVFIVNPYEVHGGDCEEVAEYQVLYPSSRFVADALRLASGRDLPRLESGIVAKSTATAALMDSLDAADGAVVERALQAVLRTCTFARESGVEDAQAVRIALEIIQDSDPKSLSTDALARYARLHPSHFIRVFHRTTGLAPQAYLRQLRIAEARRLICEGVGLVDAAQSAGFCDQAHLTREFRKVYGVTPGCLARSRRVS
jgi:AraC-like DNA-binding protein